MELIGATIWGRKTLESDVFFWKPDKWFKIWFFLVTRVNHNDNKQFKKGECFTTYSEISQYTKASKDQIDKFMRWSKEQSMLTTQKTTRGMIVYLLNYEKYQDFDNYKSDTKSELKAKQKRNRSDTINNNDNNDNKNKYSECVFLTDDEHKKLVEKYGELNTRRFIEKLNNYKGANGKKYASDYKAILNWVVESVIGKTENVPDRYRKVDANG